jgi:UDP-N-acetylmuramoyl-L-alanyl-D-glutamate--2,6-diaminopimelate ligase
METISAKNKPMVVVDYSHTPDALENALKALRPQTQGKLWCVFGCGGDRDQTKRPLMAKIAETLADRVVVTNDNPRHEDAEQIIKQIMQGFARPEAVLLQLDRAKAIQESIQCATEQDCILIAGKGAERYQQIGDEKRPFDDVAEAKKGLGII